MVIPSHGIRRPAIRPTAARRILVSAAAVLVVAGLLAVAVPVQAHGDEGHGQGHSFGCPPAGGSDLLDPAVSAFDQVGAEAPAAPTQTFVGCSGNYVFKVTTADPLIAGTGTVAFLTVHNVESGQSVAVDSMIVEEAGAVTSDERSLRFLAARVHGADGLRAVTLRPVQAGTIDLILTYPTGEAAGRVTVEAAAEDGGGGGQIDELVPGFEAPLLAVGVGAALLLLGLRRRGGRGGGDRAGDGTSGLHRLIVLLLAAALVASAGGALAHAGHDGEETQGVYEPEASLVPGGFNAQPSSLEVSFASTTDEPVQLYDFGDYATAEGPDGEHTYPTAGLYVVHLIAYDPATLEGRVHSSTLPVGPEDERGNDAPTAAVLLSTRPHRWAAFGQQVTLDASGTTEINDDPVLYQWSIGRADINSTDFSFAYWAVTDTPQLTWTVPSVAGDYRVGVTAVDARRGWAEAGASLRVTEQVPVTNETFGPFSGSILLPHEAAGLDVPVSDARPTHEFNMSWAGSVNVSLSWSSPVDVAAEQGIPDVDIVLRPCGGGEVVDQATASGTSDTLTADVGEAGCYEIEVTLENGVQVDYSIDVEATYLLDPFA